MNHLHKFYEALKLVYYLIIITFDQSFKVTSVPCSILDFNLLSYELTLCLTLFTAVENIVKNKTFIVCAFQPDRHDEYWSCKFS